MKRMIGFVVVSLLMASAAKAQTEGYDPFKQLELTPAPAEDWVAGGPSGGDVCALVVDHGAPGVVYAGTFGGIFKRPGSMGWKPASNGLSSPGFICALEADPLRPGVLYAEDLGRIYKTVDGGENWKLTDSGLPEAGLPAIDPSDPKTLYTETPEGLFKSTDGGETWRRLPSVGLPDRGVDTIQVDYRSSSVLYAATDVGVFKSVDAGQSWMSVNSGLPEEPEVTALIIAPASPTLYAIVSGSVFRSYSGGLGWEAVGLVSSENPSIHSLVVDPRNSAVLYAATETEVFKSRHGGDDWQQVASRFDPIRSLAIDPSTFSTVYVGTVTGVLTSVDAGESWTPSSSGLTAETISSLIILDSKISKTIFAVNPNRRIFQSPDAGEHWNSLNTVPPGNIEAFTADLTQRRMLFVQLGDTIYSSADAGATWSAITPLFDSQKPLPTLDLAKPTVICATLRNRVLYSTDGGGSWTLFAPPDFQNLKVTTVWLDPNNTQAVYVAVGFPFPKLYGSDDGGKTWNEISEHSQSLGVSIFVDSSKSGRLYMRTSGVYIDSSEGDIYKSLDGGKDWVKQLINPSVNVPVDFFAAIPADPAVLFAGIWTETEFSSNSFVLLKSTDGGSSWAEATSGLPESAGVASLISDPDNPSILYAGTGIKGVFKSADGGNTWRPTNPN